MSLRRHTMAAAPPSPAGSSRKLGEGEEEESSCAVRVAVRVRPLSSAEIGADCSSIVQLHSSGQSLTIRKPRSNYASPVALEDANSPLSPSSLDARNFSFDYCFQSDGTDGPSDPGSQEKVFEALGQGVVDSAFEGFNCSLFAYGQTGSGKTHTMVGENFPPERKGLVPRICEAMFDRTSGHRRLSGTSNTHMSGASTAAAGHLGAMSAGISEQSTDMSKTIYRLNVSYCEIYLEKVKDLLMSVGDEDSSIEKVQQPRDKDDSAMSPTAVGHKLRVREHPVTGPYVEGLKVLPVKSFAEVEELLKVGAAARTVASTLMNAASSRSHAIFTITFFQTTVDPTTASTVDKVSRINLIDLAGSERADSSGTSGERLKEASTINKSLTTLGRVIACLSTQSSGNPKVVPYRDSVLTWLLRESLGGNAKTTMISTISPADRNYEETLSTLRYADSAKRIMNRAVVNEDSNTKIIRQLREEVERLKQQLQAATIPSSLLMPNPSHVALSPSLGPSGSIIKNCEGYANSHSELRLSEPSVDVEASTIFKLPLSTVALINLCEDIREDREEAIVYILAPGTTVITSRLGLPSLQELDIASSGDENRNLVTSSTDTKEDCRVGGILQTELNLERLSTSSVTISDGRDAAQKMFDSVADPSRKAPAPTTVLVLDSCEVVEGEEAKKDELHKQLSTKTVLLIKLEGIKENHCIFEVFDNKVFVEPMDGDVYVGGDQIQGRKEVSHRSRIRLGFTSSFRVHVPVRIRASAGEDGPDDSSRSRPVPRRSLLRPSSLTSIPNAQPERVVSRKIPDDSAEVSAAIHPLPSMPPSSMQNITPTLQLMIEEANELLLELSSTYRLASDIDIGGSCSSSQGDGIRITLENGIPCAVRWTKQAFIEKLAQLRLLRASIPAPIGTAVTTPPAATALINPAAFYALASPRFGSNNNTPRGEGSRSVVNFRRHHSGLVLTPRGVTPRSTTPGNSSANSLSRSDAAASGRVFNFNFIDNTGAAAGRDDNLLSPASLVASEVFADVTESGSIKQFGQAILSLRFILKLKKYEDVVSLNLPVFDAEGCQVSTLNVSLQRDIGGASNGSSSTALPSLRVGKPFAFSLHISDLKLTKHDQWSASRSRSLYFEELFGSFRFCDNKNSSYTSSAPRTALDIYSFNYHVKLSLDSLTEANKRYLEDDFLTIKLWGRGTPILQADQATVQRLAVRNAFESLSVLNTEAIRGQSAACQTNVDGSSKVVSLPKGNSAVMGLEAPVIAPFDISANEKSLEGPLRKIASMATNLSVFMKEFFVSLDVEEESEAAIFALVPAKLDGTLRLISGKKRRLIVSIVQADHTDVCLDNVLDIQIRSCGRQTTSRAAHLSQRLFSFGSIKGKTKGSADADETANQWTPLKIVNIDKDVNLRSITASTTWETDPSLSEAECNHGDRLVYQVLISFTSTLSAVPIFLSRSLKAKIYPARKGSKPYTHHQAWWSRDVYSRKQHLGSWFSVDIVNISTDQLKAALSPVILLEDNSVALCHLLSALRKTSLERSQALFDMEKTRQELLVSLYQEHGVTIDSKNLDLLLAGKNAAKYPLLFVSTVSGANANMNSGSESQPQQEARSCFLQSRTKKNLFIDLLRGLCLDTCYNRLSHDNAMVLNALPTHVVTEHSQPDADAGDMCGFLMIRKVGGLTGFSNPKGKGGKDAFGVWQRRWLVLKRPFLYIYKEFSKGEPLEIVEAARYQVNVEQQDSIQGIPFSFRLCMNHGIEESPSLKSSSWHLQASTAAEMRAWVVALDPLKIEARDALMNQSAQNFSQITAPLVA